MHSLQNVVVSFAIGDALRPDVDDRNVAAPCFLCFLLRPCAPSHIFSTKMARMSISDKHERMLRALLKLYVAYPKARAYPSEKFATALVV